jgi:oxygen-dependent protoporphyrinogen oxidase
MIVVVGAGITGLAVGHALERAGADVLVLEATDRPGGVIRSAEVDGRILDWGPQRTRLTPGIARLVQGLDLGREVVTAPPGLDLFVYRDGRLRVVPFSPRAFVSSDVVGPAAKLRLLLEPLTAGAHPEERVSAYFTRKLGREVYETLVAPLYGGLYASDPADMEVGLSLIHVLREFGVGRSLLLPLLRRGGRITPPPAVSFAYGMQAFPDALAAALGDRLRLETPVHGIEAKGAGWSVRGSDRGSDFEILASSVVLAIPAPRAASLIEPIAPRAAGVVGGLRYNPLGVVHLDAETDLRGLGFQVSFTERYRALRGVTFNDSLFSRRNLYTAYLGGALRPDVARLPDDLLAALAVREFRETTGFESRPLAVERETVPAWDVSWRGLADLSVPDGLVLAGNWHARPGIPGRLAEAARIVSRMMGDGRPASEPVGGVPASGKDS